MMKRAITPTTKPKTIQVHSENMACPPRRGDSPHRSTNLQPPSLPHSAAPRERRGLPGGIRQQAPLLLVTKDERGDFAVAGISATRGDGGAQGRQGRAHGQRATRPAVVVLEELRLTAIQ